MAVFANAPPDNPFLAGGFQGPTLPDRTVSVGVNGAGVLQQAILNAEDPHSIASILQSVKHYASIMYSVAESIRYGVLYELSKEGLLLDEANGITDLSIAATDERDELGRPVNSVAAAFNALGVATGGHGTLATVGMLIDAIKKSGASAVSYVGGLSGTFIPLSEDAGMADAVARGHLSFARYLSMTSVCSVGIDMAPVFWDPTTISGADFEASIAGVLMDEAAIGIYTNKATSVRLVPVPYAPDPSNWVVLMSEAGMLGESPVLDLGLSTLPPPSGLLAKQGALPAPLTSLRN